MLRPFSVTFLLSSGLVLASCGTSEQPSSKAPSSQQTSASEAVGSAAAPGLDEHAAAAPPLQVGTLTLPGECPEPRAATASENAAEVNAPIPIKVGLTLSHEWKGFAGDYEHECLTQVTQVDDRSITISNSCPIGPTKEPVRNSRTLCRRDLQDASILETEFVRWLPEVLAGTTQFSLSRRSFAELKSTGGVEHRYVSLARRANAAKSPFLKFDYQGKLLRQDTTHRSAYALDLYDTVDVLVNAEITKLPVINLEGILKSETGIMESRAKVLDSEFLPLLLDYELTGDHFRIAYTKISFPTDELEHALDVQRRLDVYGIYFDFGSDQLRPESGPVLRSIAEALQHHPDWKLAVNGHTDNVGEEGANQDLSARRSEAVRTALFERYSIDKARLVAVGLGQSQPKETNETAEGRARNRRVELVRLE
ncbi:MAG: OmpA family protein [Gammaproteobacteria bacterium]